jgi:hypothetical protein
MHKKIKLTNSIHSNNILKIYLNKKNKKYLLKNLVYNQSEI